MSSFNIPILVEDKRIMATEISRLGKVQHLHKMTYNLLAQGTGFKPSKVRNIIQDMLDKGEVIQFDAPTTSHARQYIYFLSEAGEQLIAPAP